MILTCNRFAFSYTTAEIYPPEKIFHRFEIIKNIHRVIADIGLDVDCINLHLYIYINWREYHLETSFDDLLDTREANNKRFAQCHFNIRSI